MAVETITDSDFEAFIAKLNSVDFTDTERSLLGQIFAAAAPGEVEGFGTALTLTPAQIAALVQRKISGAGFHARAGGSS